MRLPCHTTVKPRSCYPLFPCLLGFENSPWLPHLSVLLMLRDTFSFMAIVKVLATIRAKEANLRHRDCFYARFFETEDNPSERKYSDVAQYLPPRRAWARPDMRRGKYFHGSPINVLRDSIYRKVQGVVKAGRLGEYEWGRKLEAFVSDVQSRVEQTQFDFTPPALWLRAKAVPRGAEMKFRCISSYRDLSDRVVLALANKYLSAKFDVLLSESCYAFRSGRKLTYMTAIRRLIQLRKRITGRLFVADCDLRRFFDSVPHGLVRNAVSQAMESVAVDPKIRGLLEGYLSSYSLQMVLMKRDELQKQNPTWRDLDIPSMSDPQARGLPQGGSLSGLLANLVLRVVDQEASREGVFFARYCDDMLFVAKTRDTCARALDAVVRRLELLDIPIHPVHRRIDYGTMYYAVKSKGPYCWADPSKYKFSCVPWVTFVGYSIKYDGTVRIRKESVQAHAVSIREECKNFLDRISMSCKPGLQEVAVAGLFYRLVAKGIGRFKTGATHGFSQCWLSAFRMVGASKDGLRQMRYLDRIRSSAFALVLKKLKLRLGKELKDSAEPELNLYLGKPFSYYGASQVSVRDGVARNHKLLLSAQEQAAPPRDDGGADNQQLNEYDEWEEDYRDVDFTSGWERASGR